MIRTLIGAIVVLLLCSSAASADYLTLLRKGKKLAEQGKHKEAVEAYDQAYKLERKPGALYFKALSQISLGQLETALRDLPSIARDPRTPKSIRDKIAKLVEMLRQKLAGSVTIEVPGVKGAEVFANGKLMGKTPLTFKWPTGPCSLKIEKDGYAPVTRRVEVRPKGTHALTVELKRLPGRVRILVEGGGVIFLNGTRVGEGDITLVRPPGEYSLRVVRKGFQVFDEPIVFKAGRLWTKKVVLTKPPFRLGPYGITSAVTGSIGLAILIGAGVSHGLAVKTRSSADSGSTIQRDAQSKIDTSSKEIKAAWILYGIGGAAVATSIVFLVLEIQHQSDLKRERLARFPLRFDIGRNGVSLSGKF